MKFQDVNWLSRKLIITVILFISATIFLLIDKSNMQQWMDFCKWIFVIYAGANTGSKWVKK